MWDKYNALEHDPVYTRRRKKKREGCWGCDGDGGRVVVRAAVVRLRLKKTVAMVRVMVKRRGW